MYEVRNFFYIRENDEFTVRVCIPSPPPPLPNTLTSRKNTSAVIIPVNTKHFYNICTMLDPRRRRWADVVSMLIVIQMFCVCWNIKHLVLWTMIGTKK